MILIIAQHTNGKHSCVGIVQTEEQMRTVGQAIVQSPSWQDVYFLPVADFRTIEAAKMWTMDYWLQNPDIERKVADDPLVQALLRENGDKLD